MMLFGKYKGATILVIAVVLPSWSCNLWPRQQEAASQLRIQGNKKVEADSPIAKATVGVIYNERRWLDIAMTCSGVLITKRLVLTAGHCFPSEFYDTCKVSFGTEIGAPGAKVLGGTCHLFADPKAPKSQARDFALIYLDDDAPEGFEPVPLIPETLELKAGMDIVIAGFGTGIGKRMPDDPQDWGVLRFAHQRVQSILPDKGMFKITRAGGALPCHGDSGGPVYLSHDDRLYVAGIIIGGDSYSREYGYLANVAVFRDWIKGVSAAFETQMKTEGRLSPAEEPSMSDFFADKDPRLLGQGYCFKDKLLSDQFRTTCQAPVARRPQGSVPPVACLRKLPPLKDLQRSCLARARVAGTIRP